MNTNDRFEFGSTFIILFCRAKGPDLKALEIWDGLAFCLNMDTFENQEGQITLRGIIPPLTSFQEMHFCQ